MTIKEEDGKRYAYGAGAGGIAKAGALSLIPAFCLLAASKFPDYPVREAGDYSISTEKAGVVVGIQPVEDLKEQKTYFKFEMERQGLIPVLVVMRNRSSGDSFLFDAKKVDYWLPVSTDREKPPSFLDMMRRGSGGVWGGRIGDVNENMLKNELQSKVLSAGASMHGFVYIRFKALWRLQGAPITRGSPRPPIHLQVPVTRVGTDETVVLDLVF